ncbi:hypothetical protein [Sabulicella glaciei]|uniref:Uncharacterized protein n=1 Tax=Sabulicella glaciei TaxID=2984948 RepID=A0ABT3NSX5_9PROT|nr:hypothetical protein [Roseococcus sp. MDT2-1-1]MCW8085274.1 hypothetical protein [Roseococcus sp. MDT2-1-1]
MGKASLGEPTRFKTKIGADRESIPSARIGLAIGRSNAGLAHHWCGRVLGGARSRFSVTGFSDSGDRTRGGAVPVGSTKSSFERRSSLIAAFDDVPPRKTKAVPDK